VAVLAALASLSCAAPMYKSWNGTELDEGTVRSGIVEAAMALYNERANEHYTQGGDRWYGIANKIRP
jgi:hypothetical protein